MKIGFGLGLSDYRLSGGAGYIGILDLYPNATVAYSVRKLRAAYAGSAIRVRRSSDNAEQDIGFTALGDLDETSLTTFVGSNNAFIVTWYDQSGNANNATQSTPSLQPQIVSSGTILTMNSKPCMTLDGSDDFLALTTQQSVNTDFLHTFVAKRPSSGTRMYGLASMSDYLLGLWSNDFYYLQGDTTGLLQSNAQDSTTNRMLLTGINSASTKKIYKDGTEIPSTFIATPQVLTLDYIGRYRFLYSPASLQEIIFYNSNQISNRTGIEGNINTYYAIY